MKIAYTIDNDALNKLLDERSTVEGASFMAELAHRCDFYATPELLEEALCVDEAIEGSADRVRRNAGFFLEYVTRIFNEQSQIVLSELRQRPRPLIFMDASSEKRVRELLREVANGGSLQLLHDVNNESISAKESQLETTKQIQENHRNLIREQGVRAEVGRLSYAEFKSRYWCSRQENLVMDVLDKLCGFGAQSEVKAKEVCHNLERFPWTKTWLETEAAGFYWNFAQDRTIERGDRYDRAQLVYLTDEDILVTFVTADAGLRRIGKLVFGDGQRRVLSSEGFKQRLAASAS